MAQAQLVGLDFGSTTSHAMVATADILRNCVTERMELGPAATVYRSEPVFTPFDGDRIDEGRLAGIVDQWISDSGLHRREITAGGAIVTGLAAQAGNAGAIARLVRARLGDAVIATADDPRLEAWLAFMGSCFELSRDEPGSPFLNLDIGGGTTNLAWGRGGAVARTGCLFVGARHVQAVAGSYEIAKLSRYAVALLERLGIEKRAGDVLGEAEVGAIVGYYVGLLEACVTGEGGFRDDPCARLHEQIAFSRPSGDAQPVLTLSGGVGELAYRLVRGEKLPCITAYGDLGIDLALGLARSPLLSKDLRTHTPLNLGRATVYGLTLRNTEISGTTLFLARPDILPLRDLPILARLPADAGPSEVLEAVELARGGGRGACLQILSVDENAERVKRLGRNLARAFQECGFPTGLPLVLFVPGNVGKVIGSYATEWGRLEVNLVVIDEIACREARFASLGAMHQSVVPVSFYGM